jgi:hypothetical protein
MRPTPPHTRAGLLASSSLTGRHSGTTTTPGSISSRPSKSGLKID